MILTTWKEFLHELLNKNYQHEMKDVEYNTATSEIVKPTEEENEGIFAVLKIIMLWEVSQ